MYLSRLNEVQEHTLGSARLRFLVPGAATGGAYELMEFRGQPGAPGPRPHYHRLATETFIVLEGAIELETGAPGRPEHRVIAAPTGTTIHVPKGTIHAFRYTAPETRMLAMLTPATDFGTYLKGLQDLHQESKTWPPDAAKLTVLMARHDAYAV